MKKVLLITVLFIAVLGTVSGRFVATASGVVGAVSSGMRQPLDFFLGVFRAGELERTAQALRLKNADLEAQILVLRNNPLFIKRPEEHFVKAKIYSSYPFNNRSVVIVNAGVEAGVQPLQAVTVGGEGLLFGHVVEANKGYSLVRTVADEGWEIPVRVGAEETDGLFVGGRTPRLTLVVKGKPLVEGSAVYTASRSFPYGLTIGKVSAVRADPAAAFQEADVVIPYGVGDLAEVLIRIP